MGADEEEEEEEEERGKRERELGFRGKGEKGFMGRRESVRRTKGGADVKMRGMVDVREKSICLERGVAP